MPGSKLGGPLGFGVNADGAGAITEGGCTGDGGCRGATGGLIKEGGIGAGCANTGLATGGCTREGGAAGFGSSDSALGAANIVVKSPGADTGVGGALGFAGSVLAGSCMVSTMGSGADIRIST